MKYEDEFEGLLSEALSDARDAEPRAGLEERVIAGVRASIGERKLAWWKWAAVAAVIGIAVLVWTIKDQRQVAEITIPNTVPHESRSLPQTASPETIAKIMEGNGPRPGSLKRVRPRKPKVRTEVESARASFPTPTPMTEEEKALMLLARIDPDVIRKTGIPNSPGTGLPEISELKISEIKIEPLKLEERRGER